MQKNCSKCGGVTDYDNDLHCRKIFKVKINELIVSNEIEKARILFISSLFNEEWKKSVLNNLAKESESGRKFRDLITDEERFKRIKKEVEEYDTWAKKEADLNLNRRGFVEIANKYQVDTRELVDDLGPTPLGPILLKIDDKKYLEDSEIKWLENKKKFDLLGIYYYLLYKSEFSFENTFPINLSDFLKPSERLINDDTLIKEKIDGKVWNLAKACGYFRKDKNPQKTIEVSNEFARSSQIEHSSAGAAVFTSRGGALKDLKDTAKAKTCAIKAIEISPNSFHAYNLLGAICFLENNFEEGEQYFDKAIKLGSSPKNEEFELRTVLKESEQDRRKAIKDYLFKKDPIKYAWVKKFN